MKYLVYLIVLTSAICMSCTGKSSQTDEAAKDSVVTDQYEEGLNRVVNGINLGSSQDSVDAYIKRKHIIVSERNSNSYFFVEPTYFGGTKWDGWTISFNKNKVANVVFVKATEKGKEEFHREFNFIYDALKEKYGKYEDEPLELEEHDRKNEPKFFASFSDDYTSIWLTADRLDGVLGLKLVYADNDLIVVDSDTDDL